MVQGKDSFYFAKKGFKVIGIDGSEEVIKINKNKIEKHSLFNNNLTFNCVDLSNQNEVQQLMTKVNEIAKKESKNILIYTRFFLHAITEDVENLIFESIFNILKVPFEVASEFRTKEDEELDKIFNNHYRRYVDTDFLFNKAIGKRFFADRIF